MRAKTTHSNGYSSYRHEKAIIRLDLNDLIRRKKEEEQRNKKTNLLIVGVTSTIAIIVLSVLSL